MIASAVEGIGNPGNLTPTARRLYRRFADGGCMRTEVQVVPRTASMNYRNIDLKIDQFISYVNQDKVNLIPTFQRGHVWTISMRQKLLQNIVRGRPIPAIFLYREASGEIYTYNILDGKQRLESILLFVGNERSSFRIDHPARYFHDPKVREQYNFPITVCGKTQTLAELDDGLFRDFRDYVIPTIEITLSDDGDSALDEIIDLFVDINSYGAKVKRFDIVKAMSKDLLLRDAFKLIAIKQKRGKDIWYRSIDNVITWVLKQLQVVDSIQGANSKVDRMWELLVEIVMFQRTAKHKTPTEILKNFIKAKNESQSNKCITKAEIRELKKTFGFLKSAYKNQELLSSRLASNQIHFYSMVTSVIADKLIDKYSAKELTRKLAAIGTIINGGEVPRQLKSDFRHYQELSAKHTTHPGRRAERQTLFTNLVDAI